MSRPAQTTEAVFQMHLPPLSRALIRAGLALAKWEMRRRTRGALNRLDAHLLRDIGLSHADRQTECDRPFWRS